MKSPRSRRGRATFVGAQALAAELSALLERLDIPAVLTDRAGTTLATTRHADALAASADRLPHRVVEMRLNGLSIRVSIPLLVGATEPADLTPRQQAVLGCIQHGLGNREIAAQLGISVHTVRRHVEGLLRRLNVPSRSAAAALPRRSA